MSKEIVYVERKPSESVSIEKVFRQIAKNVAGSGFHIEFQQLNFSNDLIGTLKNLVFFKKRKADIYHVTGHVHYIALILPRKNTVLTVHDVGILHIRGGLRRFILKKLLFDLPIKRLKYITAVSETTKNDIIKYTNCHRNKIKVIENPLQDYFFASNRKQFNADVPTILQIGTTANKNLSNLIEAVCGLKCRLKIIGSLTNETKNLLKSNKIYYENESNLSNDEIKQEYANADIVAFCSTFEGFGLPIIEAQAMKVPVVTSNISPMKEVSGEGAALVDPHDFRSIRQAIDKIINDVEYRERLINNGIENVERYRADKIAKLYINLYQQILEKH